MGGDATEPVVNSFFVIVDLSVRTYWISLIQLDTWFDKGEFKYIMANYS